MTATKRGGRREGAGRPAGRRNIATRSQGASLSELARKHTADALSVLVSVAKNSDSDSARVAAANAILDRGYGKPRQAHEHSGPNGGPIPTVDVSKLKGMSDEELDLLERALVQIGLVDGDQSGEGDPTV